MWLWHLRSPQALTHGNPAGAGPSIFSREVSPAQPHTSQPVAGTFGLVERRSHRGRDALANLLAASTSARAFTVLAVSILTAPASRSGSQETGLPYLRRHAAVAPGSWRSMLSRTSRTGSPGTRRRTGRRFAQTAASRDWRAAGCLFFLRMSHDSTTRTRWLRLTPTAAWVTGRRDSGFGSQPNLGEPRAVVILEDCSARRSPGT